MFVSQSTEFLGLPIITEEEHDKIADSFECEAGRIKPVYGAGKLAVASSRVLRRFLMFDGDTFRGQEIPDGYDDVDVSNYLSNMRNGYDFMLGVGCMARNFRAGNGAAQLDSFVRSRPLHDMVPDFTDAMYTRASLLRLGLAEMEKMLYADEFTSCDLALMNFLDYTEESTWFESLFNDEITKIRERSGDIDSDQLLKLEYGFEHGVTNASMLIMTAYEVEVLQGVKPH